MKASILIRQLKISLLAILVSIIVIFILEADDHSFAVFLYLLYKLGTGYFIPCYLASVLFEILIPKGNQSRGVAYLYIASGLVLICVSLLLSYVITGLFSGQWDFRMTDVLYRNLVFLFFIPVMLVLTYSASRHAVGSR